MRRIHGEERSSDTELVEHYQQVIRSLGGQTKGYWEFAVCVARPDGQVWETTLRSPRLFTAERSQQMIPGYPLESLQVDPKSGQYISEMTAEEQVCFWQQAIGAELCRFIESIGDTIL